MKQNILPSLVCLSLSFVLSGCDDSESNDDKTGVFIDSPVANIAYKTESKSGFTGRGGEFKYAKGETVTFSIGDISLPAAQVDSVLTLFDLTGTENVRSRVLMNIARLLQSLDVDGDPSNGIAIADQAHVSATGMSILFDSETFDDDVVNLVANSGSSQVTLKTEEEALDHLIESYDLPDFYGISYYTCEWVTRAEQIKHSDDGGVLDKKNCNLKLSAGEIENTVSVLYSEGELDDIVSYEYDGLVEDGVVTFGGEFPEDDFVLYGTLRFDAEFAVFTGSVVGSAINEKGVYAEFEHAVDEGGISVGNFFSLK